jgi:hypothetical protein
MAATKKLEEMTPEEYREYQEAEWGQYVATQPIFVDGVRAFNAGDPVPAGHVKNGLVAKAQVAAATEKGA